VDTYVNTLVGAIRTPTVTVFMWLVSLPGDPPVIAPITIVAALLLAMWGLRAGAVLLLATMAGEAVVQHFVAVAFGRARPPASFALIQIPAALSFPSGHAWASLLLAAVLGLVLWRSLPRNWTIRVAIVSGVVLVALLVGSSRVYLGVHWPTDVFAGWIMAVVSFVAVSALYLWVVKRFHIKELDPPLGPLWLRVTATTVGLLLAVGLLAYDARLNPLTPGALKVTSVTSTHSETGEAAGAPQHRLVGREPKCA
jgi:membrane-associated phospholipid phosphatase